MRIGVYKKLDKIERVVQYVDVASLWGLKLSKEF